MTDIRDIITGLDTSRFTAGFDNSVLDAVRRATVGIDISSFRSLTAAAADMDNSVLDAARRATAGIDTTSFRTLTSATAGIDNSVLDAARRATAGIDTSSFRTLSAATAGIENSVLDAARRATAGVDASSFGSVTAATTGINTSAFSALTAATAGLDTSVFSAMNEAIDASTFSALTAAVAGIDTSLFRSVTARLDTSVFSAMNAALDSTVFSALRVGTAGIDIAGILDLSNLPTSLTIDHEWLQEVGSYSDEEVDEICQTASDEIEVAQDYRQLSDQTKKVIIWLVLFIWPVIFDLGKGLATNEIYAHLTSANTILLSQSSSEIKAMARGKQAAEFNRSMLKGYRVVTSGALNFRYDPRMKSEIITTLTRGTLLEVVDDSSRTWIQVAVEVNGEEELGWVSKRYTILVR